MSTAIHGLDVHPSASTRRGPLSPLTPRKDPPKGGVLSLISMKSMSEDVIVLCRSSLNPAFREGLFGKGSALRNWWGGMQLGDLHWPQSSGVAGEFFAYSPHLCCT